MVRGILSNQHSRSRTIARSSPVGREPRADGVRTPLEWGELQISLKMWRGTMDAPGWGGSLTMVHHLKGVLKMKYNTQTGLGRRLAVLITSVGLFCGASALSMAQSSNAAPNASNPNASATGNANASATGHANSNVSGLGPASGTAPVPETSTWVAMATLVAGAAYAARRRRRTTAQ